MKTTIWHTVAFGLTLCASHALAGSETPLSELSRYNDPMGSGEPPVLAASSGDTAHSFDAPPLSELSRYNDPIGSGPVPAVVHFTAAAQGAQRFAAQPLGEISRYNDPMGSGTQPEALARPRGQAAATEPGRVGDFSTSGDHLAAN